ncbi:dihydrodipicolinate synthase family protein [Granulosicoccus antarcticus]|uniref:4-hydroxy-tetrahydrodipicolinate synthase n=1 Tax=Granulosicoccus antarcticus IMCC3135 TaxID=1192854 RepID=A0A2Z2NLF3_9GAMM|nr:dihydrodipicolinate synthase family protein [Granulosicoccus antarcticus]ASJ70618.1 4-hydroxy-tetrahydrodipicolinate synthase [Granulosicoccus antarcticus IMCC3135]
MTSRFSLDGIYTPLITPMHEDGSIDYESLTALIENLIACGVHGVVSGGSTGENYTMDVAERLEVARFTKQCLNERLPLIVGTGAMRTPDSIALARGAREMGAEAILLGTPPYSVPTEQENALNALAIDREADLPIVLYNYPGRMGVNMGEDFLDRVSRSRNIVGIKESSGDINRVHLLARDYPHIQMCCGMDDQALEFFAWGARSWICAGSNFLPEEHVLMYETCVLKNDYVTGRRIMSAMLPLMLVLEQGGKFIQCVKHGVELSGLDSGPMRPPLKSLNKDEKRELEQVVRILKSTIAAIRSEG